MCERCNCGALDCPVCHPENDHFDTCNVCGQVVKAYLTDDDGVCLDCRNTLCKCPECGEYFDPKEENACPECGWEEKDSPRCSYSIKDGFYHEREVCFSFFNLRETSSAISAAVPLVSASLNKDRKTAYLETLSELSEKVRTFDAEKILQEIEWAMANIDELLRERKEK